MKTVESAEKQRGNAQEKSHSEQHFIKNKHLSKLTEVNDSFGITLLCRVLK